MFGGSVVNPTIFYIGLIVLAITALVGNYFHLVPIEVFNTILGAILGSSVTLASQVTILAKEVARREAAEKKANS